MSDKKYDIITEDEIDEGLATDAYFDRTDAILEATDTNPYVVAEISADLDNWHVLAGLKDAAHLLEGKPVDLYAPPEGTLFHEDPVIRIEGKYLDFGRYETPFIGFISQASAIATSAMRVRAAAGDTTVLSFGSRRQHPATAAMIERSAMIGGMDGISNIAGGQTIGIEAGGTMPHALVICMRDQKHAWQAYNDIIDEEAPRLMICDTYEDEKKEAIDAAELLGDELDGVRLDTSSSRRGDMHEIIEEVRWELNARGFEDVEIFVTGGIGVDEIREFKDITDGFGVGQAIASSSPVDFSLDIVTVEDELAGKRGKKSGRKQVYRDGMEDTVALEGQEGSGEALLEPIVKNGEIVADFSVNEARERCSNDAQQLKDRDKLNI